MINYLLLLLTLLVVSTVTALDYSLVLSQVVHRHGSRSPEVDYNETEICGTEYPCGFLNAQGQTMLVNTGAFLRHRYTKDPSVVDPSNPFITSDKYNLSTISVRSSSVLRTLQSADALVRGLFPDLSAYYPAVVSETKETDLLLRASNIAAIYVDTEYAKEEIRETCNPVVDKNFPKQEDLLAIAAEVFSEKACAKFEKRTACAKKLCDIGRCYQSSGRLDTGLYPLLEKNVEALCEVGACISHYKSHYDEKKPNHRKQGSRGQLVAQEILGNIHRHLEGKSSYRLMTYSTHDSTLRPLAGTMGDNSYEAMMPPFASSYVFELLLPAGVAPSMSEGDYAIRVLRGNPGRTPASNYTFAWDNFQLTCRDESGSYYAAANNTCPLVDFIRFIDSSKPEDPAGLCFIEPHMLDRMECRPEADGPEGVSDDCRLYRRQCPEQACRKEFLLDVKDYSCKPGHPTPPPPRPIWDLITGPSAWACACFAGGVACTLLFLYMAKHALGRSSRRYQRVPLLEEENDHLNDAAQIQVDILDMTGANSPPPRAPGPVPAVSSVDKEKTATAAPAPALSLPKQPAPQRPTATAPAAAAAATTTATPEIRKSDK